MGSESSDPRSDALSYDILTGMREWRLQHPDATLTEIEQALDERWYLVRARMLAELALQQEAADAAWQIAGAVPVCPLCGMNLSPHIEGVGEVSGGADNPLAAYAGRLAA